jgi:hypothetical protein
MADNETTYYTDASQQGYRRDAAPNMASLSKTMLYAEFDITLASVTGADNFVLGKLGAAATIYPTQSFLMGTSGAVSGVFALEKVSAPAATPVVVGAAATVATDGVAVPFTGGQGAITADEFLQLTITTATDLEVTDTVKLIVAYLPTRASIL